MKTWLRLLAVLMTVGGGFVGVTITFNLFGGPNKGGSPEAVVASIFMALYGFVVAAGLLFVYDPRRTRPMLVAFALQIPWLSLPVFEYRFAAGLNAVVAFGPSQAAQGALSMIHFGGASETAFRFSFGTLQEGPWRIGINLVAALLYILLWMSVRTSSKRQNHIPRAVQVRGSGPNF